MGCYGFDRVYRGSIRGSVQGFFQGVIMVLQQFYSDSKQGFGNFGFGGLGFRV